jgi:4-hydroxythreonine-4-phosphate dehydrogenase
MNAAPIIALAMGDPAGISPELTAKLVATDEIRAGARLVVIGDRRIFDEGARVAGVPPEFQTVTPAADPRSIDKDACFMDLACMRNAGFAEPRIAVAGLNPHAGDGGNFGREEIDAAEMAARGGHRRNPAVSRKQ